MVVNLEFIRAIVTAEEVLLVDPLRQDVLPFVDQLRQQLPHKSAFKNDGTGQIVAQDDEMLFPTSEQWLPAPETVEGMQAELPFEFQVLEIALEVVCTFLDSSVAELERDAYPVLDELAMNVSTKNLERVRSLKSNLTRLLARVQKVLIYSVLLFRSKFDYPNLTVMGDKITLLHVSVFWFFAGKDYKQKFQQVMHIVICWSELKGLVLFGD